MDLKFRDTLPPNVLDDLEQLTAELRQYLYTEHDADGHHASITPTHATLQGALVGEYTDLPYDATRFQTPGAAVWTVTSANVIYLRMSRIGQMAFVQFAFQNTTLTVDTTSEVIIRVPELHAIPARDANGNPQNHVGGTAYWNDIPTATISLGQCSANAVGFGGIVPYTEIHVYGRGMVAVSANVWMAGSCWFMTEKNNVANPFYGS